MEKFSDDDIKLAKDFADFYVDLFENHLASFPYHLSENAVLDWFGQTVKGPKKIGVFLKNKVATAKHNFPDVELCPSIGCRDTHVIKLPTTREHRKDYSIPHLTTTTEEKTPPNVVSPSSSKKREKGQGDGVHNCNDESPVKRTRLNTGIGDIIEPEPEETPTKILNVTSQGNIEFHRQSSKKYQRETKWSRPCKFNVAFSKTNSGYLIHLIIYEGKVKCRRNLMKDFDSVDGED